MAGGAIYSAIVAVIDELSRAGVAKSHRNEADNYRYRSINDVLNCLSPLLARHRLCTLPRVLERTACERAGTSPALLHVGVRVAFDLVSAEDCSVHTVECFGEALDSSDKATAKALSAAYKAAMTQVFCIPTGEADADATSHRVVAAVHEPEPVQGWEQWAGEIIDTVDICASEQAIDLVQERNLTVLKTLRKERPELYRKVGACFTARREALRVPAPPATKRKRKPRTHVNGSGARKAAHA